jgi:asparaginyl-tRNA synthetase
MQIQDEEIPVENVLPSTRDHLTSETTRHVVRVQNTVLQAARDTLRDAGFVEILTPIIGPVTDPGIRGSKQVDVDYYGNRYRLMTSAILYKQASLLAFDKVHCLAPNVRMEPLETASTSRHLAEFHQIDVEAADFSREQIMDIAERVLRNCVRLVMTEAAEDLVALGRDPGAFRWVDDGPFDQMTHAEAVRLLQRMGHPQSDAAEIDWDGEALISTQVGRPFFITDYPKGSRGFYDMESTTTPGVLRNFDLIAAEGYGELASGGEREHSYRNIITRMRETGENPAKYAWYLELAKEGIPASAGFGIGLERLIRFIAGLESVWQASAYPKVPGVLSP